MKSDYDKWFIHSDGTALLCKREKLIDELKDAYGSEKAAQMLPSFRRATSCESCKLELKLLEE